MAVMKKNLDKSLSAKFVIPIALENMFNTTISVLLAQVNSRISSSSLVAISLCNTAFTMISALFGVLTTGTVLLVARHVGAGEREKASDAVEQAIMMCLLSSLVITAACILLARPLILVLMSSAEDSMRTEAVRYFRILMLSMPFQVLSNVFSGTSRALNNTKTPLIATVSQNLVQITLAVLLINAFGLNEVGSGLAVASGWFTGAMILTFAMVIRQRVLAINLHNIGKPNPGTILRILKIGLPVSVESILLQAGYLVAGSLAVALGTFKSAVYHVMNTLYSFISFPQSICQVTAMMATGHLLGAGKVPEARMAGRRIYLAGTVVEVVLAAILILLTPVLAPLYSEDSAVIADVIRKMWIMIPYLIACISVNCIDPTLKAGGDVKFVMINTVLSVWLIRIPLTYLFCFVWDMGAIGIFWGNIGALTARSVSGLLRKRGTKWIKVKI